MPRPPAKEECVRCQLAQPRADCFAQESQPAAMCSVSASSAALPGETFQEQLGSVWSGCVFNAAQPRRCSTHTATSSRSVPRMAVPLVLLRFFTKQPQPAECPGTREFVAKCGKPRARRSRAVCRKPISRRSETLGIEMVSRPQQQLRQQQQQQQQSSNVVDACHWASRAEGAAVWASNHLWSCDVEPPSSTCTPLSILTRSSHTSTPPRACDSSRGASIRRCLANDVNFGSSLECQKGARFNPSAKFSGSWSHPVDIDTSAPAVCKPPVRSSTPPRLQRDKSFSLEAYLQDCQIELAELQQKYEIEDNHRQHSLFEKVEDLSWRLVHLSEEALECSCHRNVPGSMDVYEETNAALDSAATLLCCLLQCNPE